MDKVPFFYSIRFKFIFIFTIFLAIVTFLTYQVFTNYQRKIVNNFINKEGTLLVDLFIKSSTNAILDNDKKLLLKNVNELKKYNDISYIHIYKFDNEEFKLFFSYSDIDINLGQKDTEELIQLFLISWVNSKIFDFKGVKYIDFSKPILKENKKFGILCIGLPAETIYGPIKMVRVYIWIISISSFFIAVILAVSLSNLIIGYLNKILGIIKLISTGEFSQKIYIKTKDEFNQISKALNKMSTNIGVLYHVTSAMNYMDTNDILKLILNKAVDSLNASHGSIMTLDENEEYLTVKKDFIHGIKKSDIKEFIKIPVGEGIAGKIVQAVKEENEELLKELMIVNTVSKSDKFKIFRPELEYEKNIKSLLCVPLKADKNIYGVINIVNKKDGTPFELEDCQFLNTLASQAALALTKAKLYEDSITDGLTKLYIHRYFQSRLLEELKRAERYSFPVSLLMIDIDHFKRLNDTYGHQVGDLVLSTTSSIIKTTIRENIDIPCRYGGEELAIIMPQTDTNGAYTLAERVKNKITEHIFKVNGTEFNITVSMGISTYPINAKEKNELIKKADMALYLAKACGRNRIIVADELPE